MNMILILAGLMFAGLGILGLEGRTTINTILLIVGEVSTGLGILGLVLFLKDKKGGQR